MRYGVISDIHSNYEAFRAAVDALSKERIDAYLCLGDVIGYGADPHACLKLLQELKPKALVAGNHEWAVLGLTDISLFNADAREAVLWTRKVLTAEELEFLKTFELVHETRKFVLTHGTLDSPSEFGYMLSDADARRTMSLMKVPLCFVGHSHVGSIFYSKADKVKYFAGKSIEMEDRSKYVVNSGSIGQPRDFDPKASYVVYDDEKRTIELKRVKYDIKAAQEKILKVGLPDFLAYRLSTGR
ncbi:MAG: metallophosphoesterase family protein [Candidatus Omnitrophota bacterium]|jgi:predicted phosphodiesterase